MPRYIDLDKAREAITLVCEEYCDEDGCINCKLAHAVDTLYDQDIVEVVLCEDCKYWGGSKYSNSHETDFVCEYWESDGLMWNDFCSMGERKNGQRVDKSIDKME